MSDLTVLNTPILTDDGIKKYWFDNNPSLTHFMSAVSVLFPEGERYFMKSMNHYRNQLSQETIKELNLFCKQEINHGRLHETLNRKLESLTSSILSSIIGLKSCITIKVYLDLKDYINQLTH